MQVTLSRQACCGPLSPIRLAGLMWQTRYDRAAGPALRLCDQHARCPVDRLGAEQKNRVKPMQPANLLLRLSWRCLPGRPRRRQCPFGPATTRPVQRAGRHGPRHTANACPPRDMGGRPGSAQYPARALHGDRDLVEMRDQGGGGVGGALVGGE